MEPKIKVGQFIVKKWCPVKDVTPVLGTSIVMYSRDDKAIYGVFEVKPYIKGDWEAPASYKVNLEPVGESKNYFFDIDFYTSDLRDTPDEMIFTSAELAEKFVKEFLTN